MRTPQRTEIESAVERVRRVPSQHREYVHDVATARRTHGIPEDLLKELLDVGLPHGRANGTIAMDGLDLANVSFMLGLPSARAMALRGWATALRAARSEQAALYTLTVAPHCLDPGCEKACEFSIAPEVAGHFGTDGEIDAVTGCVVHRRAAGGSVLLPDEMRALTAQLASVEFHLLPPALQNDVGFLRSAQLADCPLAAEFLFREAGRRGFAARKSFGIFMAVPYSIPHMWIDLLVDGEWLPVDPLLLAMLASRGIIDAADWLPFRTLGGVAWRLHGEDVPLALHGGQKTTYSLPTMKQEV
ncbi:hypothetical protein AB0C51_00610 [Streptomyces pathocidini]|uniref:hypothetical protein n=1 Tax=Streptomyces pathocidini TaxID=1650571 RepID=UPI0033CD936D